MVAYLNVETSDGQSQHFPVRYENDTNKTAFAEPISGTLTLKHLALLYSNSSLFSPIQAT